MSSANSTTAALGRDMTASEAGHQGAVESGIVDFLREAGDALGARPAHMSRTKTLKAQPLGRMYALSTRPSCSLRHSS
jgi:hypothetical protein